MALELLVDEDTSSKRLVSMLAAEGHDVVSAADEQLLGSPDPLLLDRARQLDRVLLTQNVRDFRELHEDNAEHPGILGVFHERDRARDMTYAEIVRAIGNLEASEVPIASAFHVLNMWR